MTVLIAINLLTFPFFVPFLVVLLLEAIEFTDSSVRDSLTNAKTTGDVSVTAFFFEILLINL